MLLMLELHDGPRNKQQFTTLMINDDKMNLHLHFMYNIAVYTMLFFPYIHSIFHRFQITLQNNMHKPQQPTVCVCVCVFVCAVDVPAFLQISLFFHQPELKV